MRIETIFGNRRHRRLRVAFVALSATVLGCQADSGDMSVSIATYRDRMLVEHRDAQDDEVYRGLGPRLEPRIVPVAGQSALGPREALMSTPDVEEVPAPEDILLEIPDPVDAAQVFESRLEALRNQYADRPDSFIIRNYARVVDKAEEYLQKIPLETQYSMSLSECIQRALEHNYSIRIEAHNPAISQTRVVEAEAAFDAEFYLDTSWSKLDQATASTFQAGSGDVRSIEGGFRQLLPSGMQTSVALSQQRQKNDLPAEFQTLNPVYNTDFTVSFTQPLLRGFGLDVNRAEIIIRQIEHRVTMEQFVQKVRDTLVDVETAYWDLLQSRRAAAVLAESVAQNFVTYQNMRERLGHDATEVEVANSQARWESRYVEYLESVKLIRDAEDRLKDLMNDPEFLLSEWIEIIPTELPFAAPMSIDHFGSVRTALERRSEIRQARDQIDSARVSTNLAKNQILPQLDLSFQYQVQGIGNTSDNSFDNLTTNRFISYTVAANFVYNIGERAARAGWRRARLQESQALVGLNQIADAIVEEVNVQVRTIRVRYEQIPPQLSSVQAAARNLRSLQARTTGINPNYLETELSAVEQLSNTRDRLLRVLVDYNLSIIRFEKAKGTLLDYNNVTVTDVRSAR